MICESHKSFIFNMLTKRAYWLLSVDIDLRLPFLEIVIVVAPPLILHCKDEISNHHRIFADASFVGANCGCGGMKITRL